MRKLILIRHGESIWNKKGLFTGWTDVKLSKKGIIDSIKAGKDLKDSKFKINVAFTSELKRAQDTLFLIANELDYEFPIHTSWKLNERHYGKLQGLNKKQTILKFGEKKVFQWRRSVNTRPPLIELTDKRNPKMNKKYKKFNLPNILGESLLDTKVRVVDYFDDFITKNTKANDTILIVAHGNSLRALIQHLENLTDEKISKIEIPTAKFLYYEY